MRGGRWRRRNVLSPAFPGTPLLLRPASYHRARTLSRPLLSTIFLLSSRSWCCDHGVYSVSFHLDARSLFALLLPLAERTARRPGRSEQLSPAFHPHTAPARPGDVPLAYPMRSPPVPPSIRSADALSVSLPRSTPLPSLHLHRLHSHFISSRRFENAISLSLSRSLLRFSSYSLFSIRWETLLPAILSTFCPCYLAEPYRPSQHR